MAINLNNNQNLNQPQAGKPRSSGFTNIQRVLGANQGNKLGQTIGQGVQSIAGKTQGQTNQAQQQFQQGIGTAQQDINKGQQIQSGLTDLDFSNSQGAAEKLGALNTQDYQTAAKNLRQGYQGPQGLQDADKLNRTAQDLNQTGQNLLTTGGRQAALQRFVNAGPNYTQGKQRLDSLLLGQDTSALRGARRSAQQTAMQTGEAVRSAGQQGQAIGQQYGTLAQDVQGKLTGAQQAFGGALDQRTQDTIKGNQEFASGLQQRIKDKQLSDEDAQFLMQKGLVDSQGNTFNLSTDQLAGLFGANTNINTQDVLKSTDLTSRDALAKLAGLESGDKLRDFDETKVDQDIAQFTRDQQGAQGYEAQKAAAEQARKAFTVDPRQFLNDSQDDYQTSKALNYDEAARIAPLQKEYKAASDAFYASGGWSQPNARAKYNDIARLETNLFTALNPFGAGNTSRGLGQTAYSLNPAAGITQKFEDVNKQYGIGNNLNQLLANRGRLLK